MDVKATSELLRRHVSEALADITAKEGHLDAVDDAGDTAAGTPITRLIDHTMGVSWLLGVLDAVDELLEVGLEEEASVVITLAVRKSGLLKLEETPSGRYSIVFRRPPSE